MARLVHLCDDKGCVHLTVHEKDYEEILKWEGG